MNERKEKAEMSFLEHLEDLRWTIIHSILAMVVGATLAFIFKDFIFDVVLISPKTPEFITNRWLCHLSQLYSIPDLCINNKPFELINIKMSGQFTTHIVVSLVAGIVLAFPYIFYKFWSFIRPALHEKEQKYASGAVFYSSFLFLSGVLFGYFVIVPLSVHFLGSYSVSEQVINQIALSSYIGTLVSTVLASGVIFELPIIIYFLSRIGLVTPALMKKYRKHSIVGIFLLAAIITPPDVFSQTLVAIPLLILYEISILVSASVEKAKEAK